MRFACGRCKGRKVGFSKGEIKMTALGDLNGIFDRSGVIGKQRLHLGGAFIIKLLCFKADRRSVGDDVARLDTKQDCLRIRILTLDVMHVVGGHHTDPRFLGDLTDGVCNGRFIGKVVILDFQIKAVRTEDVPHPQGGRERALHISCENCLGNLSRKAGGQGDQTLAFFAEEHHIDTRLCVKALDKSGGYQGNEIAIADLIFRKKHEVIAGKICLSLLFKARAGCHVDLAPDDGAHALYKTGAVKGNRTVHHTVIGQSDGGMPFFFGFFGNIVNAAGPVKKTVLAMQMKVNEIIHAHGLLSFLPAELLPPRSAF